MRVLLGVVAVLVALPLLLGGVALWAAMQHRADDGSFTAPLAPVKASGYAVVVPDVDALLHREAPFVRGGQTTLRFTARTGGGSAFLGLAPRPAVERYLTGVPYAAVTQVRLARGGLPVAVSPVAGTQPPAPPIDQTFWLVSSTSGTLFWSPSNLRGEHLALVVMSPAGGSVGQVDATAAMTPRWLDPTTYGLLILGTVAFLIGMVLLFWPRRHREIVYVVEPSQVPEIAARLGISTEPLAAALGGAPDSLDILDPAPDADPPPDSGPAPGSGPGQQSSTAVEPARQPAEPAPHQHAAAQSAVHQHAAAQPAVHQHAAIEPASPAVEPPAWLVEPDRVGAPPAPPAPVSPASLMSGGVVVAPAVGVVPAPDMPFWNGPTPVPVATGQPGMYRSFTSPPPTITPSFVWPPIPGDC